MKRKAASDNRAAQRFPTSLSATVVLNRKEYAATIQDISTLGCRLSGAFSANKGDELIVIIGVASVVATVVWVSGGIAGAMFHQPVDPLRIVRENLDHPMFYRRREAATMSAVA